METLITYGRVVDLTHPIRPDIPRWPGDPPVEFEPVASIGKDGYRLRRFSMGEHSGTHLSTPSAFWYDGVGPAQIRLESLVSAAVMIDVSDLTMRDPDYALSVDSVKEWERRNGEVPSGCIVLLFTGWERYWDQPERFINADAGGTMHFPGFGMDAARFLLERRGVSGLGIDTHGIDPGTDTDLSVSRFALGKNALVLECLNNLRKLPTNAATVVVGRLPLMGGSGSPASVLALVP